MNVKFITGVIQGIKVLESKVNDFCKDVEVVELKVSTGGAQVIACVTYKELKTKEAVRASASPSSSSEASEKKTTKKKTSKATSK